MEKREEMLAQKLLNGLTNEQLREVSGGEFPNDEVRDIIKWWLIADRESNRNASDLPLVKILGEIKSAIEQELDASGYSNITAELRTRAFKKSENVLEKSTSAPQ